MTDTIDELLRLASRKYADPDFLYAARNAIPAIAAMRERLVVAERVMRELLDKLHRGSLGPWHEEWLDDTRAFLILAAHAPKTKDKV